MKKRKLGDLYGKGCRRCQRCEKGVIVGGCSDSIEYTSKGHRPGIMCKLCTRIHLFIYLPTYFLKAFHCSFRQDKYVSSDPTLIR